MPRPSASENPPSPSGAELDRRRAFCFALPPALALIMPLPVVAEVLGYWREYIGCPSTYYVLGPIFVGLAAAPGYLYAASLRRPVSQLTAQRRWWLRLRGCLIADLQPGRLQRMARGKSAQ